MRRSERCFGRAATAREGRFTSPDSVERGVFCPLIPAKGAWRCSSRQESRGLCGLTGYVGRENGSNGAKNRSLGRIGSVLSTVETVTVTCGFKSHRPNHHQQRRKHGKHQVQRFSAVGSVRRRCFLRVHRGWIVRLPNSWLVICPTLAPNTSEFPGPHLHLGS